MSKKKDDAVWILMVQVKQDDSMPTIVQLEVVADSEGKARQEGMVLLAAAYKAEGKIVSKIMDVSEVSADNVLLNNDVLRWKPSEVITRGDAGKDIKPNSDQAVPTGTEIVPVSGPIKQAVSAALLAKAKKEQAVKPTPKSKAKEADKKPVSYWALLGDPLNEAIIKAVGSTPLEYKSNRVVSGGQ